MQNSGRTFLNLILIISICFLECSHSQETSNKEFQNNESLTDSIPAQDQDIKDLGLLKNVEDSGYPFAALTIEFPEKKLTESFGINLAEVTNVDMNILTNSIGKYVSIGYTSEVQNALLDLRFKGKSVFPDTPDMQTRKNLKTITGVLSNAAEETQGDIPVTLTITTKEGTIESFDFFIDAGIVALNGKEVTGYFEPRTSNKILAIEVKN